MQKTSKYDLPIFRRNHKAHSPNGAFFAEIVDATEVGMSDPTMGDLQFSDGFTVKNCNPSFVWSDDSRYLVVPQYFFKYFVFRRQRLLIIDVIKKTTFASRDSAFYFQPESFRDGFVLGSINPFTSNRQFRFHFPGDFVPFTLSSE